MSRAGIHFAAIVPFVFWCIAEGQTKPVARPAPDDAASHALLERLMEAEQSARSWQAEGVETDELIGEGMNLRTQTTFKAVFLDATHVMWESRGDTHVLTVCDGDYHWTYTEPGTAFYRYPVDPAACRAQLPSFGSLQENLISAGAAGTDHVDFQGSPRNCVLVHAEYRIPALRGTGATAGTTIVRNSCVDPEQDLILRDKTETWATGSSTRFTRTIEFRSYRRNPPALPESAFRFEAPTGAILDPGLETSEDEPAVGGGAYRLGSGVSRPQPIQKTPPSWPEEALREGISGMVLVELTVEPDGSPRDVSVAKGLGHGLDERAVEAVRQWRFQPGSRDGMPVTVTNLTVAVDFRLP